MFRFVRLDVLPLVHGDAPTVLGPILRLFFRHRRHCLGIVLAAQFKLFQLAHVNRGFQVPGQSGNITHRDIAGVEQLVRRSVGHMNDRARMKIVALVVEDHKTIAALDIDRLFAVQMFAGVPAHRNFRPHHAAAAGGKAKLGRNHQRRLEILWRTHPFEVFRPCESWGFAHGLFIGFGLLQPIRVKIAHRSSCFY